MFLEFLLPKPFVLMVTSCSEMFIICHSEDVLINVVHVSVLDMGAWPLGPMGSELVLRDDSLEGRRVFYWSMLASASCPVCSRLEVFMWFDPTKQKAF